MNDSFEKNDKETFLFKVVRIQVIVDAIMS